MARPKQHVRCSQGSWSEVKENEREEEEMALCLYECLRAVGLQRHYARFTSVGVRRPAHLSALTMEDYPILGIRSMEDRTRLFHLIRMVKTLDEDYDVSVGNLSFNSDACEDPYEDVYGDEEEEDVAAVSKLDSARFSKPSSVRRRLDFSCETSDRHQKGTVRIYASHTRNNQPGRGKGSNLPAEFELGPGSSAVCGCKENNHSVHSHQPDHHTRANSKPDSMRGYSLYNSLMRLSPKCVSPHKPKPKSTTVPSKRFSSKPVRHKDRKGISRKEKLFADISSNRTSEHMTKPTPVYESNRTAGYNYGLPLSSPPAPNKKQPGGQRISVCVRKRPLTCTEGRQGEADVVKTPSEECVIVHECKEAVDLTQYILQHRFYFDQVFGEESSNEEVYRRTAYPLVQHMLKGGKATCFAYGQTGAGKTHTMLGSSPGRPGLYALAVRDIFAHLSTTHIRTSLLVYVSFFEIYCGQLYDLLDHRKRLFAREDGQKVVHIAGLHDVRVDSVSSLLEVISQGTEERTQGMSGVNPLSSRSHALLQIQLRHPNQQIAGRMWFVDLAGSERASDTKEPDRQSRMEGAEINQSLLALKECIRSLDQEQLHTPFRQSKLTQVLKDSFVGDSMTCMIANISPGHLATENTLNTLRYADRVKELRGQGGPRGGRRGKTIPSPKRNLSNSSSSGGARGKSPPKKPKLGRRREAFGSTTPPSRSTTGGTILCSTPKDSRLGEETSAIARKGLGLEYITPIQGLLGMDVESDRRERASGRESRRRERHRGTDSAGHSAGDQNVRSVRLFSRQAADEQLDLWEGRRESGFFQRKTENQQSNLKEGREEERRRRRQVESRRDTCDEVERETDLPKVDEKLKERERHLRQYHQQLQQFMPSSASSSVHLFSAASFPLSNQASPSSSASPSSCSSLQHSSSLSVSALMHHGLEEVLDAYRAKTNDNREQLSFVTSEEICLPSETSPSHSVNNDGVGHGDSGSTDEDWRVSLEGTEASFGQDRGQNEDRGSLRATAERDIKVRSEDLRPAGMAGGGRRWAWGATTSTEEAGRMAGARPADAEAPVSYSCHSDERGAVGEEGQNASDVPAAGLWSNEEREGAESLVSTHHNNESSFFNHLPLDSVHQRAQAERPLSPACEHTNTLLSPNKLNGFPLELKHTRCTSNIHTLAFQNAQQCVPPSSRGEKGPQFAANKTEVSKSRSATIPDTTPITQNGCKISAKPRNVSDNSAYTQVENDPEIAAKIFVSPQEDTSLSDVMDPLSISLLQVDQQVATASFLQGEQNDTSLCLLENESGEDSRWEVEKKHPTCAEAARTVVEDEDVELHLSLLELPQIKTHCHPTSDAMTATNHTERRKDTCRATYEQHRTGMVKPPIPGIMLVSLQDQENNQKPPKTPAIEVLGSKAPPSLLKPSTCASVQTSVQSISSSVQLSVNTDSPISRSLMTNGATQLPPENAHNVHSKLAFSISTPQPESVLRQLNTLPKQRHRVHSNYSSNFSLQPNRPKESNGQECTSNQQNSSIIDLSTLEDLDPDQWRVVQAHWKQLEEMEALCHKEGTLLCQQPDMTFGEYVHKLEEIMVRKARCVHGMIAQLQPYLTHSRSNPPHN